MPDDDEDPVWRRLRKGLWGRRWDGDGRCKCPPVQVCSAGGRGRTGTGTGLGLGPGAHDSSGGGSSSGSGSSSEARGRRAGTGRTGFCHCKSMIDLQAGAPDVGGTGKGRAAGGGRGAKGKEGRKGGGGAAAARPPLFSLRAGFENASISCQPPLASHFIHGAKSAHGARRRQLQQLHSTISLYIVQCARLPPPRARLLIGPRPGRPPARPCLFLFCRQLRRSTLAGGPRNIIAHPGPARMPGSGGGGARQQSAASRRAKKKLPAA